VCLSPQSGLSLSFSLLLLLLSPGALERRWVKNGGIGEGGLDEGTANDARMEYCNNVNAVLFLHAEMLPSR
jgi:hypothetical protein